MWSSRGTCTCAHLCVGHTGLQRRCCHVLNARKVPAIQVSNVCVCVFACVRTYIVSQLRCPSVVTCPLPHPGVAETQRSPQTPCGLRTYTHTHTHTQGRMQSVKPSACSCHSHSTMEPRGLRHFMHGASYWYLPTCKHVGHRVQYTHTQTHTQGVGILPHIEPT